SIRDLYAIQIQLEARRNRRQSRLEACERGLRSGIVADEAGALAPELRSGRQGHQQIEPRVALQTSRALDAVPCGREFEIALAGGVRIHPGVPQQCLRVGEALR